MPPEAPLSPELTVFLAGLAAPRLLQIAEAVFVQDAALTGDGQPLAQRVLARKETFGFGMESQTDTVTTFGCYRRRDNGEFAKAPDHLLQVTWQEVRPRVLSCDCEDRRYRQRLCIHQVWLALEGGFLLTQFRGVEGAREGQAQAA